MSDKQHDARGDEPLAAPESEGEQAAAGETIDESSSSPPAAVVTQETRPETSDRGGLADAAESTPGTADGGDPQPSAGDEKNRKDKTFWIWVAGILFILGLELFIFGHDGKIEVCVGVEGVTEWALKDQARTPETFRKAPVCAERLNLGMYAGSQEAAEAALNEACKRATMLQRDALQDCIRRENKWTRQVNKQQVPPWDERLYRRLLWLD